MSATSTQQASTIRFTVYGTPTPQGSKKAFVNKHTGRANLVESAGDRVKTWRQDVRAAALLEQRNWQTITGPILVDVIFYLPRPKGHYRTGKNAHLLRDAAPLRHITKPDIDKLLRSTLDALTSAGTYRDDSQVVEVDVTKLYADDERPPGAEITVTDINRQIEAGR